MREELFEHEFTKQKNNCIQAFKAMGEENRLIHVLNEIEREKLTYKAYFKVGYECCKTEVDELKRLRGLDEMAINQISHANQQWQLKCSELQKRVDKAIRLLVEAELYQSEPNIDLAVQALKGGFDYE